MSDPKKSNSRVTILDREVENRWDYDDDRPRLPTYDWYELNRKDCLYLPEGTRHQYANMTDNPAEFFFAVAPNYR
ncbi:MAG: hypothetical protein ACI8V2_002871 [Candidatus Latescibacterota bacterium]|jgi:oxalate decarboxylase/phosphoglucose isomerase-like protein (cupin superfamily)